MLRCITGLASALTTKSKVATYNKMNAPQNKQFSTNVVLAVTPCQIDKYEKILECNKLNK